MLNLELKDAYINSLYSNISAHDDTTDLKDRTIIQRDLVLNGISKSKENFKINIHSIETDNNIDNETDNNVDNDFGNDFIIEMILSIINRADKFKELCLDEFVEKLKEITSSYSYEDDDYNFRKIRIALNMAVNEQDNFCVNIKSNLYVETTLPDYIVSDNTVLITILDYRAMVTKLINAFVKNHPDVDIIVDSFACGAVGDYSRFVIKMAESKDFYYLDQSKNQKIVKFANNVLKENAKYKDAWAVSQIALERILA